jgi:predicted Zn finger-like uncharacterized protein
LRADAIVAVENAIVTTDAKFTRCPGCSTVFRVTVAQLALREGQVRCGHCRAVFDANDHLVSLDAAPAADEFDTSDELLMGRPTVTLRSADALRPAEASNKARSSAAAKDEQGTAAGASSSVRAAARDDGPTDVVALPPQPREKGGDESVSSDVERDFVEPAAKRVESLREGTDDVHAHIGETLVTPSDNESVEAASTTEMLEAADVKSSDDGTSTVEPSNDEVAVDGTKGAGDIADSASRDATEAAEDDASPSNASIEPVASLADDERVAEAKDDAQADVASIDLARPGPSTRFEWKKRRTTDGSKRKLLVVAAVTLSVAIVLQAVLEFRDSLAARVPVMRPLLEAACSTMGCTIAPLRDGGALSIDASDLQADPAHRGLLLLSATIRNRSSHPIAYPLLELTLTDSSDQVVARRAFTPAEYAGGTADTAVGIPANGERIVRMFLDASATQQAGYRLYLFYP